MVVALGGENRDFSPPLRRFGDRVYEGKGEVGTVNADSFFCLGEPLEQRGEELLVPLPVEEVDLELSPEELTGFAQVVPLPGGLKVLFHEPRALSVVDADHQIVPMEVVVAEVDSP